MYLDANNLYGWAMSQKLLVNGFEWVEELSKFDEPFIKNYGEDGIRGYFLESHVEYPKKLFNLHSDLPFLSESNKIKKYNELVYNVHDKKKLCFQITVLKQALNHGQILKKVHRVIQFNQKAWLKPFIDMNTKLKKRSKSWFWKRFL